MANYPDSIKSFTTKTTDAVIEAEHVNSLQDEVTAVETGLISGLTRLRLLPATAVTLALDSFTAVRSYYVVDTEGGAATDDLSTITAGAGIGEGSAILLRLANSARVVTVKDSIGNLRLTGDYQMTGLNEIALIYDGTVWREIFRTGVVLSTRAGLVPASPGLASQFLNGAATPAFAAVKDSDLSLSDIATNNVSITAHGLAPKLPNDATKFLDGTGAYSSIQSVFRGYAATLADVVNTVVETAAIQVTVPANDMADGDWMIWRALVLAKNNKGTTGTATFKLYFGTPSVTLTVAGTTWSNNVNERTVIFGLMMVRQGTSLQVYDSSNGSFSQYPFSVISNDWTVPSIAPLLTMTGVTFTALQTVKLTVTLSAADLAFYVKPQSARIVKQAAT